mgnify:CR=1 FL=1
MPDNVPKEELKPSIDSIVEDAFKEQEQPQESTPAQVPAETPKESLTDKPKTDAPEEDFDGVEKGFASHPAWQKQQLKIKEAQAEINRLKPFASLLDDPVVFKRHLQRQGYNKDEIAEAMRERGMEAEAPPQLTQPQVDDFVMAVCQKKGWDFTNLDANQQSYIRDLIGMTGTVFEMKADEILSKRLKPLEDKFSFMERNEKAGQDMESVKELALRYKFDYEKDILPAIANKLDELDNVDPRRKIPFDVISYSKDLILQLVEERGFQRERQEDRTKLKIGATPLKPGASQTVVPKTKGKTVDETVDNFFATAGIKG